MTRPRARAVLRTELPIRVTRAEDFEEHVGAAFALLPGVDPIALARLAVIARSYHDGRRLESRKVNRPDCRKSLEALADSAGRTCEALVGLHDEYCRHLGKVAR